MSTRTRVKRWTPALGDAFRLAWRPALAYGVFSTLGVLILVLTEAWLDYDREFGGLCLGAVVGVCSMLAGQAVALLRLRAFPVFVITGICVALLVWILDSSHVHVDAWIGFPILFFSIAFPCGILSMMHRYELFASFYPALGYIGSVFVVLNKEHRVDVWEQSKIKAWLPMPLLFLGLFLLFWLVYLGAKQALRVELWQALSGAAERRIKKAQKKNRVDIVPKKNLIPLLVVAVMLFAGVAALSPYLWRTGKGDHGTTETSEHHTPDGPKIDADGLMQQLQQLMNAAKNTLPKLWPLLLLLLFYRPAKRALLLTHLKSPIVPTPPSERIDNLWEYVRIAAEDAGVVPASSDSIEAIVRRVEAMGRASPALYKAAEIYARTRYGFVVQPGDAHAMKPIAIDASAALRKDNDAWTTIKAWFRPLS